jgi:hypothetical protein
MVQPMETFAFIEISISYENQTGNALSELHCPDLPDPTSLIHPNVSVKLVKRRDSTLASLGEDLHTSLIW